MPQAVMLWEDLGPSEKGKTENLVPASRRTLSAHGTTISSIRESQVSPVWARWWEPWWWEPRGKALDPSLEDLAGWPCSLKRWGIQAPGVSLADRMGSRRRLPFSCLRTDSPEMSWLPSLALGPTWRGSTQGSRNLPMVFVFLRFPF